MGVNSVCTLVQTTDRGFEFENGGGDHGLCGEGQLRLLQVPGAFLYSWRGRDLFKTQTKNMAAQPPPESKSLAVISDGISSLTYVPSKSTHLAVASWDGTLQIHDTLQRSPLVKQSMDSGPLLSLSAPYSKDTTKEKLITGGMDGSSTSLATIKLLVCILISFLTSLRSNVFLYPLFDF